MSQTPSLSQRRRNTKNGLYASMQPSSAPHAGDEDARLVAPPILAGNAASGSISDEIDDILYLYNRPDVAVAIEQGKFANAAAHWDIFGRDEYMRAAANGDPAPAAPESSQRPKTAADSEVELRFHALNVALHGVSADQTNMRPTQGQLDQLTEFRPPACLGRDKNHLKFADGALFDDRLYRTLYGCSDGSVDRHGILQYYHYLTIGRARGFLPHLPIDESWYLAVYPDAAMALENKEYTDAFAHYLHVGSELRFNPSDDFDEEWYCKKYTDAKIQIKMGKFISGYHHYFMSSPNEMRNPNPLFSELIYRKNFPFIENMISSKIYISGFDHYCKTGKSINIRKLFNLNHWLDDWHNRWSGVLEEYSSFAEEEYLACHSDVAGAVENGQLRSGCHHWVTSGVVDDLIGKRRRIPRYSENYYLSHNPDVAAKVGNGQYPSGYCHYLLHGYSEGRAAWPTLSKTPPRPFDYQSLASRLLQMSKSILISVIVPTFNTEPLYLEKCIESVMRQVYPHWELCIADDGSSNSDVQATLLRYAGADTRIKLMFLEKNGGISAASNAALALTSGAWVALFDHDDELSPDALLEVAEVIAADPDVDLIYSDEDKISADGSKHYDHVRKPVWSPELLTTSMYIGHLTVYKKSLISQLGGFRSEYDETQDFELALRASEVLKKVHHIEKVLYHWRACPTSAALSMAAKPKARERQRAALNAALMRRGARGEVTTADHGSWRVVYTPPTPHPLVSIVIPTAGHTRVIGDRNLNLIRNCVQSLIELECYDNVEILVVDNGDLDHQTRVWLERIPEVRLLHYKSTKFNFCEKLNFGVAESRGEYILLMNDDMEVITPRFIHDMVGLASQPGIGAVGAKLLFPDGRLQHAGVVMTSSGPSHAMIGEHVTSPGPDNILLLTHNVTAVTGACMLVKRGLYIDLGGFDTEFGPIYNDVDFCLKIRQKNLRIVIDPAIKLYHFESMSKRGDENWEWFLQKLLRRWKLFSDPYTHSDYNPSSVFYELQDPGDKIEHFAPALRRRVARDYPSTADEPIRFSIISASYNTPARFLYELEESILGQFYQNFEWIVVEDASTDSETLAWFQKIRENPRVKAIKFENNQGIMGGLRAGLGVATGDYILPVDADDFLMLDTLSLLAEKIISGERPACIYTDECKSNPQSQLFQPFHKPDWDPILFSNLCYACHLACIRRDIAIATGCYEDDVATWCHDWDTYWRIYRAGHALVHVPEVTYAWRIHGGSTASVETFNKPHSVTAQAHVLKQQLERGGWGKWLELVPNELVTSPGMWRLKPKSDVSFEVSVVVDVGGRSAFDMNLCLSKILAEPGIQRIYIVPGHEAGEADRMTHLLSDLPERRLVIVAAPGDVLSALRCASEESIGLVCWIGPHTTPIRAGWLTETVALMAAVGDTLLAGGRVIGLDERLLWAGGYFGVNGFLDSPDFGASLEHSGYHGFALCQHSVDGVPSNHWVAQGKFLAETLRLMPDGCGAAVLAAVLALQAKEKSGRVIYTPFNLMKTSLKTVRPTVPGNKILESIPADILPASQYYNPQLSGEPGHHWVPRYQIMHDRQYSDA